MALSSLYPEQQLSIQRWDKALTNYYTYDYAFGEEGIP
jgi:hypothetical protein